MNNKGILTWWASFAILVQVQIGIGILSLPRDVHNIAEGDGWISVLLAGLTIQLFVTVIWLLATRFNSQTLYEFAPKLVGKYLGRLINLAYSVYFLSTVFLTTLLFTDILKRWVLFKTPHLVIYVLVIGVAYYLAKDNIKVIARFYTFTSGFVILLIFILVPALVSFDIRFVLPVGQAGMNNIVKGIEEVTNSMLGFELLLVLFPFIDERYRRYSIVLAANGFVTILYTLIVFITITVFSPAEIKLIPEPVLYMLKSFQFDLVERIDLLFMSVWFVSIVTTLVMYLYVASLGITTILKRKSHAQVVAWCALLIITVLFIAEKDIYGIDNYVRALSNSSYLFIFVLPLILLFLSFIRKERSK
ncbi:GerAB/ArcD/ProY family transporter [Virgibacillus halodenitrificans]|uniref:GerAB/ArcD/ProY family transporter n=1 Tax=Virgibacillus halodenitrificans TaxID=1482 RepID=UPI0024C0BD17|nr:GerAB/ArcD/ProY family transporter [Virgibacillus halodenitrificans]WHX24602.1 GerAB/ArcD/ProY family transporter [Virgibacillus halodenitrificans]